MITKEDYLEVNPEFEKKVAYIDGVPFVFDSHDITNELKKFIDEYNISTLAGELNNDLLAIFLVNEHYKEGVFATSGNEFGVGSSKERQISTHKNMRELFAEGKKFWILDNYPFTATDRNKDSNELIYLGLYIGFLLTLLAPSPALLVDLGEDLYNRKIRRRSVLQGLLGFMFTGFSSYSFYEAAVKEPKTVYLTVTDFLRKIINQPEYLSNIKILVDVRNLVMLQNYYHMLDVMNSNENFEENILFFAALGHKGIDDLHQKGKEHIKEKIINYIDILINDTLDFAIANRGDLLIDVDKMMNDYISMYPEPSEFGMNTSSINLSSINPEASKSVCSLLVSRIVNLLKTGYLSKEKKEVLENSLISICLKKYNDITRLYDASEFFDNNPRFDHDKPIRYFASDIRAKDIESYYPLKRNNHNFTGIGILYGKTILIKKENNMGKEETVGMFDPFTFIIFRD